MPITKKNSWDDSEGVKSMTVTMHKASVASINPHPHKGKVEIICQTSDGQPASTHIPFIFSNRSGYGKLFLILTGIKSSHFGAGDPIRVMLGKECLLQMRPRRRGPHEIINFLPLPSGQYPIAWEKE